MLLARPLGPLGARAAVLGRVALAVAFAAVPAARSWKDIIFDETGLYDMRCRLGLEDELYLSKFLPRETSA